MSDDLTPEQQEVRRLLADARHDEPVPAPVVARLDRVLADLAADPVRVAPVTELASRRRRAASLLLAAAAVVAIGVGVGQVVDPGAPQADDLAGSSQEDAGAASDGDAEAAAPYSSGAQQHDGIRPQDDSAEEDRLRTLVELGRDSFTEDAAALRRLPVSAYLASTDSRRAASEAAGATCRADAWGAGRFVPVRYAGLPAVLVFRRASGDTQVADLFLCGDSEPRRSVTLPAP